MKNAFMNKGKLSMRILSFLTILLLLSKDPIRAQHSPDAQQHPNVPANEGLTALCARYKPLNQKTPHGTTPRSQALYEIQSLLPRIAAAYRQSIPSPAANQQHAE